MSLRRPFRIALLGVGGAALVAVQVMVRGPSNSLLWADAFNAGHAPLYGLVALAILGLLRTAGIRSGNAGIRTYVLAFTITVAAGIAAECIQLLGLGDAGPGDVARDALGAAAFLLGASTFDRELACRWRRFPPAIRLLLGALLLGLAFAPLAETALALLRRDAAFPMICDFGDSWESKFVLPQEADLQRVPPPAGWMRDPSDRVGSLAFHEGTYPGVAIRSLHRDWTGYQTLVFEAYSELQKPVELVLSIHDIGHDTQYGDRFNRDLSIEPGSNRIAIELKDLQSAPRGRQMDLSRMCGLVLFAAHPSEPFVLYLDAIRLE
jgi:hypothetical protein